MAYTASRIKVLSRVIREATGAVVTPEVLARVLEQCAPTGFRVSAEDVCRFGRRVTQQALIDAAAKLALRLHGPSVHSSVGYALYVPRARAAGLVPLAYKTYKNRALAGWGGYE